MSKVPQLRFPEFSGEWEKITLEQIANKISKKNKDFVVSNVI